MVRLHYFFDPLCGWCYGAAPLIRAVADIPGVALSLHAGGLMSGARRQSAMTRSFVAAHDRRIHALSGQPFGDAYVNGLLQDETAVLDSRPPALAVFAAETMGALGLEMLERLQLAHYVEGRRISDESVLCDTARRIGMDPVAFAAKMRALHGEFEAHLARTRSDMLCFGLRGFPALVLEQNGACQGLDVGAYLGHPGTFANVVQSRIGHERKVPPTRANAAVTALQSGAMAS